MALKQDAAQAWCALFVESEYDNAKRLSRFLISRLGLEASTADDLLHDTFYLCLSKSHFLMEHPNPAGWLYKSMYQLAGNIARQAKVQRKRTAFSIDDEDYPPLPDDRSTHDIEAWMDAQPDEDTVIACVLSRLSADELKLYTEHYVQGVDIRTMSLTHGVGYDALRKRIYRLACSMKRYIQDEMKK